MYVLDYEGKNGRLSGTQEIAQLSEILALKRPGLSLQKIAGMLAGQSTDLDRVLNMQNPTLQEQLGRTQRSSAIPDALRMKIAAGELLDRCNTAVHERTGEFRRLVEFGMLRRLDDRDSRHGRPEPR
ncbi:hypothetical protein [Rhizobium leguminosarum]|uniref:hypothetical protein n=1 Tax=Rhizobium leguminosarum TaxID=384 RepID=UPI00056CFCA9|nr:hypothetical protein [Rhizobium leguminosarum]